MERTTNYENKKEKRAIIWPAFSSQRLCYIYLLMLYRKSYDHFTITLPSLTTVPATALTIYMFTLATCGNCIEASALPFAVVLTFNDFNWLPMISNRYMVAS